jgi:hypothetical protein
MVLLTTSPQEGEPRMAEWQVPIELVLWIAQLTEPLWDNWGIIVAVQFFRSL